MSLALARRALAEFNFEDSAKYADQSAKAAPDWAQPELVSAQVRVGEAIHGRIDFSDNTATQKARMFSAEGYCSKAIDLARAEKDIQTEKAALILRIDIRLALKKTEEAAEDADRARGLSPNDASTMVAAAQVCFASDRIDEGIAALKKAYRISKSPEVAFALGCALQNQPGEANLNEALEALRNISLSDVPTYLWPTTIWHAIQCLGKKKDWQGAHDYLSKLPETVSAVVEKTARAQLEFYQDRTEEAVRHALEAKSLLSANESVGSKGNLANLLMQLGRPADALPLWEALFEMGSCDPKKLLSCAAKLHRDDIILQTCDRLHKNDVDNWEVLEFEIPYLEKYQIDLAIKRLETFISRHPEHKQAKLFLSLIGLRLDRPELVKGTPGDLPSVNEVSLRHLRATVQVMKFSGNPNAAVDYAYQFLRLHFNELEAHQTLIASMMPGPFEPTIPASLDVVGPDSAVCYRELGTTTWVVLEDTDTQNADFEEISLSSALATELMGKRVGDTFVLARGLQIRTAEILEIMPKWVRRYQDTMGEMQVRFGAASSVESVRLEEPMEGKPPKGFDIILESIEKRALAVADAKDEYQKKPFSLHWYASRFDGDAYQALFDLAQDDGQSVKCCTGNSEEYQQARQSLQTAKGIVVDITALATLRLLELERILSTTKFRFVISQNTWVLLRQMLSEARFSPPPSGTFFFEKGRHMMYQHSPEEKARNDSENAQFIELVEKSTVSVSAMGLAAVEPRKREALEKFFGVYGAETLVLASNPEYVLWTDDLVHGLTSAQEFGARRVWTQLVLGALSDEGLISPDEFSDASAKLVGMDFVTTLFDSSSMLSAFRLASWSADKKPAAQIVKIFSDTNADVQRLIKIFIDFTKRLYREQLPPETKCFVTQLLLDLFAKRPKGLSLLTSMRNLTSQLFGVNWIGKKQFEQCYDRWLSHRENPLIISP